MGARVVLSQVNLVVKDMDAMAAFYERLGLTVGGGIPEWNPHHRSGSADEGAEVDLDSEAFASVWNRGWPGGAGVVLGFRVQTRAEVDALFEELTGGGHTAQQRPYDAFWGARFAVVEDPDGNAVGLMSPLDPALRTDSPPPPM
jgi:uncharacterized glyoxalase superfamily protein PhnB